MCGPGSMLLCAQYNFGMCYFLLHRVCTPASSTFKIWNFSKQTEHFTCCDCTSPSWNFFCFFQQLKGYKIVELHYQLYSLMIPPH